MKRAFTLIELLLVIGIISVLALIAVVNFLEAQTRGKVVRAKSDLRTVALALEAYAVTENDYPPNDGVFNVLPVNITTPVAYITNSFLADPFKDKKLHHQHGELMRYYSYLHVVKQAELAWTSPPPPIEGVDGPIFNMGAMEKYGPWRVVCNGPDGLYSDKTRFPSVLYGSDIAYDPTNGTTSWGNILKTQKSQDFRIDP